MNVTLPQLDPDKRSHANYGALIGAFVSTVYAFSGLPLQYMPWSAIFGALVCGLIKEVLDYMANEENPGSHGVEMADALVTTAGGVVVAIPIFALQFVLLP